MDYLKKIKKCEDKIHRLNFKTGLAVATIAGTLVLLIGSLVFIPSTRLLFLESAAAYVIMAIILLHAVSSYLADVRYNKGKISRLKEQQASEQLIRDKSEQFNAVYDNIMFELQARKDSNAVYRRKFKILIDECRFESNVTDPKNIIMYTKEGALTADTVSCPQYLRDLIVYLQNNLGEILK